MKEQNTAAFSPEDAGLTGPETEDQATSVTDVAHAAGSFALCPPDDAPEHRTQPRASGTARARRSEPLHAASWRITGND